MRIAISFFAALLLSFQATAGDELNECVISGTGPDGGYITITIQEKPSYDSVATYLRYIKLITVHDLLITEKVAPDRIKWNINRDADVAVFTEQETVEGEVREKTRVMSKTGFRPELDGIDLGSITRTENGRYEYSVKSLFGAPTSNKLSCKLPI